LKTYPGFGNLSIGARVIDAQETNLHADIDEVAKRVNHGILCDDTGCDNLASFPETSNGYEVTRQEGGHDEGIRGSAVKELETTMKVFGNVQAEGCRDGWILQRARAIKGTVGHGTEWIGSVSRNAHGKTREGCDTRADVVCSHERSPSVTNRVDGVGIIDSDSWPILNLHASVGVVNGLDKSASHAFEELVDLHLTDSRDAIDAVSNNL